MILTLDSWKLLIILIFHYLSPFSLDFAPTATNGCHVGLYFKPLQILFKNTRLNRDYPPRFIKYFLLDLSLLKRLYLFIKYHHVYFNLKHFPQHPFYNNFQACL